MPASRRGLAAIGLAPGNLNMTQAQREASFKIRVDRRQAATPAEDWAIGEVVDVPAKS